MKYNFLKKLSILGLLYFISGQLVAQNVTIPTLPAGKTVIVVSSVAIDNPFALNPAQVSKQHTISGLNFSNVVSNDPKIETANDATVTAVSLFPVVSSISRFNPAVANTNATSVVYRVIFSAKVTGVDVTDFSVTTTGTVSGMVSAVSGMVSAVSGVEVPGTSYDVTVNSVAGNGTIRLDLNNAGTNIVDEGNVPLEGGFATGETYTIDQAIPILTPVTITSNNSNGSYAKIGDIVTLSFTSSEVINTPTVSINGNSEIVTPAGNTFNVVHTMTAADIEGMISFTIANYSDVAGNGGAAVNATTNGSSITFDKTSPLVTSINRLNPSTALTNLWSVVYRVTFSEAVSGVDVSDFLLTTTGSVNGTVASVSSANGTQIDVTVNGITSNGTIRLDLKNTGTGIIDVASNAIPSGFTTGEVYTIDGSIPTVTSISRLNPSGAFTNGVSVIYRMIFSEAVAGVDLSDFVLTNTGSVAGAISEINVVNASTYDVSILSITGDGTLRLDLMNTSTGIADLASNALIGGFTSGDVYTIDHTAPLLSPVTIASNNINPLYAKVGDQVTLSFTSSEAIAPPTVLIAGSAVAVPSPVGLAYNVIRSMIASDAEGQVGFTVSNYADLAGNAGVAVSATTNSSNVLFDKTQPLVTSINRQNPLSATTIPTNLTYRVTFNEVVSGVDISDFVLVKTGTANGSISSVSATSGSVIDVTLTTVSGAGTIRLDLKNSATGIIDGASNGINGGFTGGQAYTVGTPPTFSFCPANITVDIDPGLCTKTIALNAVAGGNPAPSLVYRIGSTIITSSYAFPIGVTQVVVAASNGMLPDATCTYNVTVRDLTPPVLSAVTASPASLWPPDHKMKDISLAYTSTDICGAVTNVVTITSNEAIHGTSDGDKGPDWEIVNDHLIKLRAERGNGREARVYTIKVTSTDLSGNSTSKTTEVRVAHNIVSPISGATYIVGSTVGFTGAFWDKVSNRHTAQWLIDESIATSGVVTEPTATKNGKVTGSYKFTTPGVYKLQMNVKDQSNVVSYANTNDDLEEIIVIYEKKDKYTYGGGWFNSAPGALRNNLTASGKASYGFSVNYFKNASKPKGETQFEFKLGDFEFNALNFDYLVISGARAQFRGTGKITNGQSGIGFIMTVTDGALDGSGSDKIRMKIYNRATNHVYYDSEYGQSDANDPITIVQQNSLVVVGADQSKGTPDMITSTETKPSMMVEHEDPLQNELKVVVSPNPSNTHFKVNVENRDRNSASTSLRVFDQYGRLVEKKNMSKSSIEFGHHYRPGIYFLKVNIGGKEIESKLIKL